MATLFGAGLLFATSLRGFLDAYGAPTFWDVVLGVVYSPQFVTWVVLPAWLIFAVLNSSRNRGIDTLSRAGSLRASWWSALRTAAAVFGTGAMVIVLSIYLGSSGLPLASEMPLPGGVRETLLGIGVSGPLVALFAELAMVFITLVSIRMSIHVMCLVRSRLLAASILAVLVWLWAVLSGFVIPQGSMANAARYLGVLSVLRGPAESIVPFAVLVGSLVVGYLWIRERDRRLAGRSATVATLWVPYLAASGSVVLVSIYANRGTAHDLLALAAQVFPGSYGNLVQALGTSVLLVGFAVAMKSSEPFNVRGYREMELIRLGAVTSWVFRTFRKVAGRALVLLGFLGVVFVLGAFLAGRATTVLDWDLVILYGYVFVVNGFLQLGLYASLYAIPIGLWPTPEGQLFAVGGLVGLSCVSMPTHWNPFSASSLARAEFGWSSALAGTCSVLLLSFLCVLTLTLVYKVRPNQLRELLT